MTTCAANNTITFRAKGTHLRLLRDSNDRLLPITRTILICRLLHGPKWSFFEPQTIMETMIKILNVEHKRVFHKNNLVNCGCIDNKLNERRFQELQKQQMRCLLEQYHTEVSIQILCKKYGRIVQGEVGGGK